MEEGIQIVEELLRTWAESTSGADGKGEDINMDDERSADTQLEGATSMCPGVPTTHRRQCLGIVDDTLVVNVSLC